MLNRRLFVAVLFLALPLGGCGAHGPAERVHSMAPPNELPLAVRQARLVVQDAYRIAFANPELLSSVPCYCGCAAFGHKSNYDCYVTFVDGAGRPVFNAHALACDTCVYITRDSFRMAREGATSAELRAYLAEIYSQVGPSTGSQSDVP